MQLVSQKRCTGILTAAVFVRTGQVDIDRTDGHAQVISAQIHVVICLQLVYEHLQATPVTRHGRQLNHPDLK